MEFWIAASYLAFEVIVECYSLKVGVLQKAILKCSSSGPLVKIFEKYLQKTFFGTAAGVKPATLL